MAVVAGGQWTKANIGVDFDCTKGVPVGNAARHFCIKHNLQQSSSFSFSKYGEHSAYILASCWCHKMEFLFSVAEDAEFTGDTSLQTAHVRCTQTNEFAYLLGARFAMHKMCAESYLWKRIHMFLH